MHDLLGNSKIALKAAYGRYDDVASSSWFSAISKAGLGGSIYRWNAPVGTTTFEPSEQGALVSTFGGSITSLNPNLRGQPPTSGPVASIPA